MAIKLKRTILTSFSILCFSFILFVMTLNIQPIKAEPRTWTVDDDGPADYPKVQEAINHANSGDTILVNKGIYYENIVINKSVSLVGEDRDYTIIEGKGFGNVISLIGKSISITGFTIGYSGNKIGDSGINLQNSRDSSISNNKIMNNRDGIGIYASSFNVISDNVIYSNSNYGIGLFLSSANVISSNSISLNSYYGIYLAFYSLNNVIYHNNFNNTQQAWSDNQNVWDYEGEGNYWSNYMGQDLNEDGIGDTPHGIDSYNKDNNPLMGMFSGFNITMKSKTYHITVVSNLTISDFRFEVGAETGNKIIRFNAAGKESTVGFYRVAIPTELMSYPYIVLVGEEEIVQTQLNISKGTYAYLYFTYMGNGYTITIITSKMQQFYNELLVKYVKLQMDLSSLNETYIDLLNNYTQLQNSYQELKNSNQKYLLNYSENERNIRNITYILAATTAIFIITTIYLSKTSAHH